MILLNAHTYRDAEGCFPGYLSDWDQHRGLATVALDIKTSKRHFRDKRICTEDLPSSCRYKADLHVKKMLSMKLLQM